MAVAGVLDSHVSANLVARPVFLAALQGGAEGAADYAQCGGQHQEHHQAAGGYGVAAHAAHTLDQPDRADRFDEAGQQGDGQGEEPQDNQAQGQQPQDWSQEQRKINLQFAPAHGTQQEGTAALYLPPDQAD